LPFAPRGAIWGRMIETRPARIAVTAVFALNGALFGVWAARIPVFVDRFALSHDQLGLLLLCIAGGAIVAFPLAGRLSDKLGAARVTKALLVLYPLAFAVLPLAPTVPLLALALAVWGATYGAMDVAMNGWGAEVEATYPAPIMSTFHAAYSLGAFLGAGVAAGAAWGGIGPGLLFPVLAVLGALATARLARVPWTSHLSEDGPAFSLPRGPLLLVGIMAFASAVGEGGVADWSAVYLTGMPGTTEASAALGFAAFSITMVVMRLYGDRVIVALGKVRAARLSGISAALGVGVVVAAPGVLPALPGFVLMGLGYALIFPLAVTRAASDPVVPPGRAIAGVATLGYGGALLGPVLIGWIAGATSLTVGLALIGLLALVIVACADVLRP